jgi:hypothetical protein
MNVLARVIIISPDDLAPVLGRTVLWRRDIERITALDADEGLTAARRLVPNLVVVGEALPDALRVLRTLRHDDATRRVSLAAVAAAAAEDGLRRSGANVVLTPPVDPVAWDRRLEELLDVPPRREARLHASFQLWCRTDPASELGEGLVLNMSVRGMLIETRETLPVGSTVDLRLSLPGDVEPLPLVGLVVRTVEVERGRSTSGVQFLILRDPVRERLRSFIEAETKE